MRLVMNILSRDYGLVTSPVCLLIEQMFRCSCPSPSKEGYLFPVKDELCTTLPGGLPHHIAVDTVVRPSVKDELKS